MLWGTVKAVGVATILAASVSAIVYGLILMLTGAGWRFPIGLVLFIGGFRGVVLAYDLMWGRPPVFSKRPWERPWEEK